MKRRPFIGLTVAFVIASLWLGLVAGPVAAKNPVRWVDDDAGVGGGPAACATAPYTTIQAAIDASESWDRVFVCPGTYVEQLNLHVKGVLVRAMPALGAHIVAPAAMTATSGVVSLVRIPAWGGRLIGFQLDIAAGTAFPALNGCSHVDVAVLAIGLHNRVRGNSIDAIGNETYTGNCGYDYGIVFGQHNVQPFVPSGVSGITVGRAIQNTVRDFKVGGILVEGEDYLVRVKQNNIDFIHADDPGCVFETLVCAFATPTAEVNNAFSASFGIGVESAARADVQGNDISSTYQQFNVAALPALSWGVALENAHGATRVMNNTVTGVADAGILSEGSSGAPVFGNEISDSQRGLAIGDDSHDIHHNTASGNQAGIIVLGNTNAVHDNDFSGNDVTDCLDLGTGNTWTGNLGTGCNVP